MTKWNLCLYFENSRKGPIFKASKESFLILLLETPEVSTKLCFVEISLREIMAF